MNMWYGEGPFGSGQLSPEEAFLARRQSGGITAFGSASALEGWGVAGPAPTETDASSAAIDDDGGIGLQQNTSSSINNDAFSVSQNAVTERQMNPMLRIKFKLLQLTDCRFFVGINDGITQITANDDGGVGEYAGTQFSTTRGGGGDTNWQFLTGDGTAINQEITDSGVPATTGEFSLVIVFDDAAGTVRMTLLDKTGQPLVPIVTHNTAIPAAATSLRYGWGLRTLTAGVKSYVAYYENIEVLGSEAA